MARGVCAVVSRMKVIQGDDNSLIAGLGTAVRNKLPRCGTQGRNTDAIQSRLTYLLPPLLVLYSCCLGLLRTLAAFWLSGKANDVFFCSVHWTAGLSWRPELLLQMKASDRRVMHGAWRRSIR